MLGVGETSEAGGMLLCLLAWSELDALSPLS